MNPLGKAYRLIALLLAGLMLATTLNLSIDMHFCKGELKSVALFGKATSCHAPATAKSPKRTCPNHPPEKQQGESVHKKGCCQNRGFQIHADIDEQVLAQDVLLPLQPVQLFTLTSEGFNPVSLDPVGESPVYKRYKPPLIQKDIPVLFETYLL